MSILPVACSIICPHTVYARMRAILEKGGLYTKNRGNRSLYFTEEKVAGNMPGIGTDYQQEI